MSDEWHSGMRRHLDRYADDVDETTAARLRSARQQALDRMERPTRRRWPIPIAAAGAVAAAVLTVLALRPESPVAELQQPSDLEVITAGEDLEMYRELEFYLWLEEQGLARDDDRDLG